MAGRPTIGSRAVILVAVAATLLATWLPPGRACACGTSTAAAGQAGPETTSTPAESCPCCLHQPTDDHADRPCCQSHLSAGTEVGADDCGCTSTTGPENPPPAAPPRPVDSDEAGSAFAVYVNAIADATRPPVTTPAVEAARGRAGPPPIDLIISLLRITC